jgi:hypothetical protein
MNKIALGLPGINNPPSIPNFVGPNGTAITNPTLLSGNLGGIISELLAIAFMVAGFISFIWALFGVYQYITAGGDKNGLAKARAKITWALVGLLLLSISFAVSNYVRQLAPTQVINVQNVTSPP